MERVERMGEGSRGVGCLLRLGRGLGAIPREKRSERDETERVSAVVEAGGRGDALWLIRLGARSGTGCATMTMGAGAGRGDGRL